MKIALCIVAVVVVAGVAVVATLGSNAATILNRPR